MKKKTSEKNWPGPASFFGGEFKLVPIQWMVLVNVFAQPEI